MIEENIQVKQYTISRDLLEKGVPAGGGPCRCTAVCCEGGVYADVVERDRILAHKDIIKKHMDETQTLHDSLWFEDRESEDSDFASGRCVGTTEINGKCAFLNRQGWCSLQVAAVAEGLDKWALKPLFCILYPIEISNRVVSFDDMLQSEEACCTVTNEFDVPLFETCKEELIHLLGGDGYRELESHFLAQRSQNGLCVPVREVL